MKKLIALLMALCCLFAFVACGNSAEPAQSNGEQEQTEKGLDLQALNGKIQEKLGVVSPELNQNMVLNMYGLTAEDCAEMVVCSDYDGTKCNEIWLIKAASEESLAAVKSLAQSRVDSLLDQSKNYNADVYAASGDARIETRGLYLLLIVTTAGDSGDIAELFLNA